MEVRIGIRDVAREVAFESTQSPDQVRAAVAAAVSAGTGLLELEDDKGGMVLVPVQALGYLEVGARTRAGWVSARTDNSVRRPLPRLCHGRGDRECLLPAQVADGTGDAYCDRRSSAGAHPLNRQGKPC